MFARLFLSISLLLLFTTHLGANEITQQVNEWRQTHEQQIVDRFAELLSIPNVASDKDNIDRNARHIGQMLVDAGMRVDLLELQGSNPVVFAERLSPGATRTVMIYVHYDGQPVNVDNWASDPWTPVMRTGMVENNGRQVPMKAPFDPDWRIFARSAGDDKAPVIALLDVSRSKRWTIKILLSELSFFT